MLASKNFKNTSSQVATLPLIPLVLASFILNITILMLITFKKNSLPPEIPLFYGKTEGIEQLAPWIYIYILPLISLLISIFNTFGSFLIKDKFIRNSLPVASFVCSVFTTIAVIKTINLVGSLF